MTGVRIGSSTAHDRTPSGDLGGVSVASEAWNGGNGKPRDLQVTSVDELSEKLMAMGIRL